MKFSNIVQAIFLSLPEIYMKSPKITSKLGHVVGFPDLSEIQLA
jgi:hypothetical protein